MNSKTSNIRANFENLAKEKEQEDRRKAEAERAQRMAQERQEQEAARRQLDVSAGGAGGREPAGPGRGSPLSPVCGVSVDTGPSRTDGFSRTDGPGSCPPTWDS